MRAVTLGVAFASFLLTSPYALADVVEKNAEYCQRFVRDMDWIFNPDEANILYSMSQYGRAYQIDMTWSPGGRFRKMTIRFFKDDKLACSWEGSEYSVFVQKENVLVYSLYDSSANGCKLVGVDLDTGKEIWRTDLQGIGMVAHKRYRNVVTMGLAKNVVVIHGNESYGNYIEFVDLKTGKTLANKTFPETQYGGKVIGIKEGNTIHTRKFEKESDLRLGGIDCPDVDQAFGEKAKEVASKLVIGKKVMMREIGKDSDDQPLFEVILPNGRSLNRELVRFGFAWSSRDFPTEYPNPLEFPKDETFGKLEAEARELKLGLWADEKPIPPWEWRRQQEQEKKAGQNAATK